MTKKDQLKMARNLLKKRYHTCDPTKELNYKIISDKDLRERECRRCKKIRLMPKFDRLCSFYCRMMASGFTNNQYEFTTKFHL